MRQVHTYGVAMAMGLRMSWMQYIGRERANSNRCDSVDCRLLLVLVKF